MTAAQRRKAVAVARDVIAQLRLKRITAITGDYLSIASYNEDENICVLATKPDQSFQKTFKEDKKVTCEVCAIGAVYIGYINKFNQVTNDEVYNANASDMIDTLSNVFDEEQLRLMEAVYEGCWIGDGIPEWYEEADCDSDRDSWETPNQDRINDLVFNFHERYANNDERLRTIMLNVIRNNGEFRLPLRVR